MRFIYLVGDLHMADYIEVPFHCLCANMERGKFLCFVDSFDAVSNKAKLCRGCSYQ